MVTKQRGRQGDEVEYDQEVILNKLDRIQSTVATILELLESVDERLKSIEKRLGGGGREERKGRGGLRIVVSSEGGRKTSAEILEEQGVLFESDMTHVKNRDKLIEHLRKSGAIVIAGPRERVVVSRGFFENFMKRLGECRGPAEAEEKIRDEKGSRFYRFLRDSGLLIYDSRSGWRLAGEIEVGAHR